MEWRRRSELHLSLLRSICVAQLKYRPSEHGGGFSNPIKATPSHYNGVLVVGSPGGKLYCWRRPSRADGAASPQWLKMSTAAADAAVGGRPRRADRAR